MAMKREEYREHLCTVINMVFTAEHNVLKQNPNILERLKKEKSPTAADEYVHIIADEILSRTPENLIHEEDAGGLCGNTIKGKGITPEKKLTTCSNG